MVMNILLQLKVHYIIHLIRESNYVGCDSDVQGSNYTLQLLQSCGTYVDSNFSRIKRFCKVPPNIVMLMSTDIIGH